MENLTQATPTAHTAPQQLPPQGFIQINGTPSKPERSKYRALIVSGSLFIVFQLVALFIVFFAASSYDDDGLEINAAGRQRMLTQRTAKTLSLLDQPGISSKEQSKLIDELKLSHKVFDRTLKAFTNGGITTGFDSNSDIEIRKIDSEAGKKIINDTWPLWSDYEKKIDEYLKASSPDDQSKLLAEARKMANTNNLSLLGKMDDLTLTLQQQAESRGTVLKFVQTFLLLAVIANFLFVAFRVVKRLQHGDDQAKRFAHSLSSKNTELASINEQLGAIQANLSQSNNELHTAYQSLSEANANSEHRAQELANLSEDLSRIQQESNTIFDSVGHGLCLIGEDWKIGNQVSSAMYSIFETDTLTGRSFHELMKPHISEKDAATLESFLGLLFTPKTSSKQLEKFNPLKSIEVTLNWDGRSFVSKQLGFDFKRIMANDTIISILVTVMDVTDKVALENELKRSAEGRERQIDLIMEIIQSDRKELEIFIGKTEKDLNQINESLRGAGVKSDKDGAVENSHELLEDIFRMVHNIKGNSSLLGLTSITESCAKAETELGKLRTKKQITGDQFLSSLVELAYLRELLSEYDDLIHSLLKNFTVAKSGASSAPSGKSGESKDDRFGQLYPFADKIASDSGKKVSLNLMSLKTDMLSEDQNKNVKDVLIQLTRNSIIHGIESPKERLGLKKWAEGSIMISSSLVTPEESPLKTSTLHIRFQDDGRGLDPKAIAKRAIEKKFITLKQAKELSDARIASLIFKAGFSSQNNADEHSGRGSGMDIVREKVTKSLNGKMRLQYETGKRFVLNIFIPLSD